MTIIEARSWITQELSHKYSPSESQVLAQQLLSWALSQSFAHLLANPRQPVSTKSLSVLSRILSEHLEEHKPLQYCLGTVPFITAILKVHPPILIPRPETEWWVALMIGLLKKVSHPKLTLLDMCTGSGCIAIALAQAFPEATIYAVDIEVEALKLAQENGTLNGCTNIIFIHSDLFKDIPQELAFDCIVSNPPYISPSEYEHLDPDVKLWEDAKALRAEDEGLSILTQVIEESPSWLTQNPLFTEQHVPQLAVEIGEHQAERVSTQMRKSGFVPTVYRDLAGKDRMVAGEVLDE